MNKKISAINSSVRDKLYKRYGMYFRSNHVDSGELKFPHQLEFPLNSSDTKIFHKFFEGIKSEYNFHMLLDLSMEVKQGDGYIHYQFFNLEVLFRLQVTLKIGQSKFIPSLTSIWKSALILEEELCDKSPIHISNGSKTEERKIILEEKRNTKDHSIKGLPQYLMPSRPTISERERAWARFGPFENGLKGRARIDLLVGDEKVYGAKVHRGFHHRNIEKMATQRPALQLLHLFERLCLRDCVYAPLMWVELMESTFDVEITDKAKALRMVWMELARVEGHLNYLWEISFEQGFYVEASIFAELLEQIYHLYIMHSGKGQNFNLFAFGGMAKSGPIGWGTECLEVAKYIHKVLEDLQKEFNRNARWMKMTEGYGLSASDALDFAVTGPNLRACGVNFDTRKSRPKYFYEDVDFQVPLGINGSTYDRFLVRFEELKQSLRIINQILDHLPAGNVKTIDHILDFKIQKNEKGQNSLAPFPSFPKELEGRNLFNTVEATEGLMGLHIVVGENGIEYFHMRSPSLAHVGLFPHLVKNESFSGVFAAFQSLSIDAWEMDR